MLVIGLLGHAGAGKDTVALLLAERFRVARVAFAEALKLEIAAAWGIERDLLDSPWAKEAKTPALALHKCMNQDFVAYAWELGLPGLQDGLTPRTVMQRWGDWRRSVDPDYFVKIALEIVRTVTDGDGVDAVLLTDVRFPNEAGLVRSLGGGLWRITRPEGPQPSRHASEWLLAGEPVDAEIPNDGTLELLAKKSTDLMLYALGRKEAA
jgi:hypothetical protein